MPAAQLEVWGDPISHSRSPVLHSAAYRVLGIHWTFARRRVAAAGFATAFAGAGELRGISVTAPLKPLAFVAVERRDRYAEATGAVNTVVPRDRFGANTDVPGLVAALEEAGIDGGARGRIIGAGATAASALVALGEVGVDDVEVLARRPGAVANLLPLAERVGIRLSASALDAPLDADEPAVTIATLPGGTSLSGSVADRLAAAGGALYDVAYAPWPSALAAAWQRADLAVHDGRGMLLHQAVRQVRLFAFGDLDATLPDEEAVIAAMREALMGD